MAINILIGSIQKFSIYIWMVDNFIGVFLLTFFLAMIVKMLIKVKNEVDDIYKGKYSLMLALIFATGQYYPMVSNCSTLYGYIFKGYCWGSFALIILMIGNWDLKTLKIFIRILIPEKIIKLLKIK